MNLVTFTQENSVGSEKMVDAIFRLRHDTFIKRLDWEIPSKNGRERDAFDNLLPFHIAVHDANDGGSVKGCWRALPTTGEYMLKDVFPELLQGEAAPEEAGVWEISRFAVRKGQGERTKGHFTDVTLDLVASFYSFAMDNKVKSYVTVTTVGCERLLRQLGVNVRRMGKGKAIRVGVEKSVALRIEVDENLNITKN